jgi:hypothetical protein
LLKQTVQFLRPCKQRKQIVQHQGKRHAEHNQAEQQDRAGPPPLPEADKIRLSFALDEDIQHERQARGHQQNAGACLVQQLRQF